MFIGQFYDEDKAVVIDPHQAVADYLDQAHRKKVRKTHIFETHRHEDYVIGVNCN